jgi:hypothetical protein
VKGAKQRSRIEAMTMHWNELTRNQQRKILEDKSLEIEAIIGPVISDIGSDEAVTLLMTAVLGCLEGCGVEEGVAWLKDITRLFETLGNIEPDGSWIARHRERTTYLRRCLA